jgi:predicted amidohydrolase
MSRELIAAAVQLNSGAVKAENFATAEELVRRAVAGGASLVVLPEYFNCLGDRRIMLEQAEPLDGETASFLRGLARSTGVTLIGGTFCERIDGAKAHNTCLTIDPRGEVVAVYRKLHLFDVDLPGRLTYCESSWLSPGDETTFCDLAGFRTAIAICYDLRFPELFRHFADRGAELIVVPAAFTKQTGRDHWELLLRARAVENQCYVVAANQTGTHAALETFGHSLVVDPWGVVTAQVAEGPGVASSAVSSARLDEIRDQLPALRHRRLSSAGMLQVPKNSQ